MKKYIKSNLNIIIPALLLLAAAVSSAAIWFGRLEQYKDWRPVSGYVVSVTEHRHFSVIVDYTYMIKGVDYHSRESFHDSPDFDFPPPGSSVTVWYDPDKPQLSSYYEPEPGLDPLAPFIIAFPLGIAVYMLYSRDNRPAPGRKY